MKNDLNEFMAAAHFSLDKLEFDKIKKALSHYLFTPHGKRLCTESLPATHRVPVVLQLQEAGEMMKLLQESEPPPLVELKDVEQALSRSSIDRFILDGIALAEIGKWARAARVLRSFFERIRESAPQLWATASPLVSLRELEQHIDRVLDQDGKIKEDASPELSRIGRRISRIKQNVRSSLVRILESYRKAGMITEEEITLRNGRLVIPVKAEYKRKIHGFIHDTSSTGQTVFIEPVEVFDMNNEIRELELARKREEERILMELTRHTGMHAMDLRNNMQVIGRLDYCHARCKLGQLWNGMIPEISDDSGIVLKQCRNPLLIIKFGSYREAQERVIPLDLMMKPDEKGVIITGPNAGGKSVTLKTFGLVLVLAQMGIPVPAKEGTSLPCIKELWIDMGDDQSIENDLSTFSSRLSWMKKAVEQAGPGHWILMDEAGSGTDPEEGTALAKAFLEMVSDSGARCLITTHHGDLKLFAHETPGWSNASMEFDPENLSPTYQFRKGIPGSSYAFEIAERLAVPARLTSLARNRVGTGKNRLESLILDLEKEKNQLNLKAREAEKEKQVLQEIRSHLQERLERIKKDRDQIRSQAIKEAESLLKDANRRIEEAIRAASQKDKETLRIKREEIQTLDTRVEKRRLIQKKRQNRPSASHVPLRPGDSVRLLDSKATGELIETDGKSKAVVMVNGMRIHAKLQNIERSLDKPGNKKKSAYTFIPAEGETLNRPFSPTLDLRGIRGDEAIKRVTRHLDDGIARGLRQLLIIHGKGDGILRKLIHEYLNKRSDIRSFELAPLQEGGEGCTHVHL